MRYKVIVKDPNGVRDWQTFMADERSIEPFVRYCVPGILKKLGAAEFQVIEYVPVDVSQKYRAMLKDCEGTGK